MAVYTAKFAGDPEEKNNQYIEQCALQLMFHMLHHLFQHQQSRHRNKPTRVRLNIHSPFIRVEAVDLESSCLTQTLQFINMLRASIISYKIKQNLAFNTSPFFNM